MDFDHSKFKILLVDDEADFAQPLALRLERRDFTVTRASSGDEALVKVEEAEFDVALLDISKPRGNVLLDRLEALLSERLPGIQIQRYAKPTFTKPAPDALRAEIFADNDFLIEALAD